MLAVFPPRFEPLRRHAFGALIEMKPTAILLLLSMLLAACGTAESSQTDAARPNFVVIIADDMAYEDSSPYGHPTLRTPNLERLAQEGIRFDQAFVTASSCSPSRASIITGRYPHNTDAEQLHWPLPADQVTFMERLKAAGYWTAAAGKWHLGDAIKDRFDEVREAGTSGFQLPTGDAARNAKMTGSGTGAQKCGCDQWLPLLEERPADRPFFLWLAALDPHRDYEDGILKEPYRPEDVVVPPYLPDTPDVRLDISRYYDEITRLDSFVGRVLDELDRQGVAEETYVIFFSDNGMPFPRAKTTVYDSGIRTPMIVRKLGRVPATALHRGLVSTVDLAPTILSLAGVDAPDTFEGRSFARLLEDTTASIRDHVFAEKHWHDYDDHVRAVRSERYKYIRNEYVDLPRTPPADVVRSPSYRAMQRLREEGHLTAAQMNPFISPRPAEELYDVAADPYELNNLAENSRYQNVLDEMRDVLDEWRMRTGDAVPPRRTPDEFDRVDGTPLPARVRPRPSKSEMGF